MKKETCTAALAALVIVGSVCAAEGDGWGQTRFREEFVQATITSLLDDEERLRELLKEMPKGADLHSHLSGAVTTERLIDWGAEDGLCVDRDTFAAAPAPGALQPCPPTQVPMASALSNRALFKNLLGAWSMAGFQGGLLKAHKHFFATFPKFGEVLKPRTDDAIADVLSIAGENHQSYVELLHALRSQSVGALGEDSIQPEDPWNETYLLEKREEIIDHPTFNADIEDTKTFIESSLDGARDLLRCDTPRPDPGCNVDTRFILAANRTQSRGFVFAQWVFAYELAQVAPQVVGINLVGPEENTNSLKYYDDEMFALDVLRRFNQRKPGRRPVHISLHAGELIGKVLPANAGGHIKFHIRRAVEMAHAERVGHGVDVLGEIDGDGVLDLLRDMRAQDVMVEICLTSNAMLLGREGKSHPLSTYLKHGVPTALATDDEGIFRVDITDEYVRAVTVQKLSYQTLKNMVRNSLEHSFLPGASLWKIRSRYVEVTNACADDEIGDPYPSAACAQLLANSERAAKQWNLEADFRSFEEALVNQQLN